MFLKHNPWRGSPSCWKGSEGNTELFLLFLMEDERKMGNISAVATLRAAAEPAQDPTGVGVFCLSAIPGV